MLQKILMIIMICIFHFIANPSYGENKIIKVNKIIFKGLDVLSKFEILNKVKMKANEKVMIIDLNSLKSVLKSEKYIKEFEVDNKKGELLISIIERKPYVIFGVYKNKKLYTIEMDKEFSIIDINNFHMKNFPIVVISEEDYLKGKLNDEIKYMCRLLNYFKDNDKVFLNQLGEIHYTPGAVRVLLKGRKTNFFLEPVYSDFLRLKYTVGHLDKMGHYPENLIIEDRMVYR